MIKVTQFETTGSLGKVFILLGNLISKFYLQNKKSIMFLTFDSKVCLPFTEQIELNLKINQKSNRKKS